MLSKFLMLLKYESKVLIKTHQIHTSLLNIFLICNFATLIILGEDMGHLYAPLSVIVCFPATLIVIYPNIIYKDLNDGSMDFLLITYGRYTILFAKLISLFLFSLMALVPYAAIIIFFFSIKLPSDLILLFCGSALCLQTSSLALVIAIIQKPFGIFSILIFAFLILTMILCGFLYYEPQVSLVYIILGIVLLNLIVDLSIMHHLIGRS